MVINTSSHNELKDCLTAIMDGCSISLSKTLNSLSKLSEEKEGELDLRHFLGEDCLNHCVEIITTAEITFHHFSRRRTSPENIDLLTLHETLSTPTDISDWFNEFGVTFIKGENGSIETYHLGKLVDWKKQNAGNPYRLNQRLGHTSLITDACINGYLFNSRIWEEHDISHLWNAPEIIQDISDALSLPQILHKWRESSKPYVITITTDFKGIIFDDMSKFSVEEKAVHALEICLLNLLLKYRPKFGSFYNPIIRLSDDIKIPKQNIRVSEVT